MAKNANYRVQLRRRREGKTDYQARKAMVVSGRTRLVARPSIKNVTVQIIIAKPIGDMVLAAANSRELIKKYGWKAATGNIPAAYLTGLLCGLKAKAAGVDAAILDLGMAIPTKGCKVFAVLHGVVDAGVEVPHKEEKIVKERTKGNHIANYAKELSEDADVYKAKFSQFLEQDVAPEKLPEHFSKVRAAIVASFKGAKVAPEVEVEDKPAAKPKAPTKAAPAKEKAAPTAEKAAPTKETAHATPVKKKEPAAKEEAPKAKAPEAKAVPAKAAPAEKSPEAEKAEKAPVKEKAPAKEAKAKVTPKEKAPTKEKAPVKEKAPAKKATKKGEKKE
jgi:large subunit ribosomal protein L18